MEKEKDMSPPPGFREGLYLHKNLPGENNLESCQHKVKVCEALVNLRRFDDTDVDKYLDRVDHQDEFFKSIIAYREVIRKNYQRAGNNKHWLEFLKLSIRDLYATVGYFQYLKAKEKRRLNKEKLSSIVALFNDLVDEHRLEVSKHVHKFPNFHQEYNDAIANNSDNSQEIVVPVQTKKRSIQVSTVTSQSCQISK